MSARTRTRVKVEAAAVAIATLIAMAACSGGGGGNVGGPENAGPTGSPVPGGTIVALEGTEPRTLDPGALANAYAQESILGNALYGQLVTNDPKTNEIKSQIAESLVPEGNGTTWTLKLKPNIVYSDGSPMVAADVKFNWAHMRDPATGSPYLGAARSIANVDVVDDLTAKITLVAPNATFPATIWASSLNWIGKPAIIQQGQAAVDANPIGAGPFVLQRWRRQDVIKLIRNPKYWDAPRPYLDGLDIRAVGDPASRYNTVVSGGADVAADGDWQNYDKAQHAGMPTKLIEAAGGSGLFLNAAKAPFNDVRARKALAYALDLNTISDTVSHGKAPIPTTLFWKDQPNYEDIPLQKHDPAEAQRLFDELAAEGKPVSFEMTIVSANSRTLTDSVQTQLSSFKNVKATVRLVDFAQWGSIIAANHDFDIITGGMTLDGAIGLWATLSSQSGANLGRFKDPQMDAALEKTQVTTTSPADLAAAYRTIQERFADLAPIILYARHGLAAYANKNVGGLELYGFGSLRPDTLWISK